MIKTLNIALVAATLFAGAAHAEGDYYEGVSRRAAAQIDMTSTGSIEVTAVFEKTARDDRKTNDSGDYFDGAVRAH